MDIPPELASIYAIRQRLIDGKTDRDDHLDVLSEWETRVKKDLIILSLEKHEGIHLVLAKAREEVSDINRVLSETRPMAGDYEKYAHENARLFDRRELWEWFIGIFDDARGDLTDVKANLELENAAEDEP